MQRYAKNNSCTLQKRNETNFEFCFPFRQISMSALWCSVLVTITLNASILKVLTAVIANKASLVMVQFVKV